MTYSPTTREIEIISVAEVAKIIKQEESWNGVDVVPEVATTRMHLATPLKEHETVHLPM